MHRVIHCMQAVFDYVDVSQRGTELSPGSYNLVSQVSLRVSFRIITVWRLLEYSNLPPSASGAVFTLMVCPSPCSSLGECFKATGA